MKPFISSLVFILLTIVMPLSAKAKVYEIEEVNYELGIRKVMAERYPNIRVSFLYVSDSDNMMFGVLLDKERGRIFIYNIEDGLRINTLSQNDEFEMEKTSKSKHTKPEVVKLYGQTKEDRKIYKGYTIDHTLGYWLSFPKKGTLKLRYSFVRKKPISFILTLNAKGQCRVILE